MRKLLTVLVVVISGVALSAQAAVAESRANTGTYGPADEPSWVFIAVGVFVLVGVVAAILSARGSSPE